ncbi:MAG: CarD family transcriptional regulator, partial [Dehalococcoidales bacterium]
MIKLLPEAELLPYQQAISDSSTELERLQALSSLAIKQPAAPLVVASAPALMYKVAACSDFVSCWHVVRLNMEVEPLVLLKRWSAMGYRAEAMVELPGTFSRRGGILDIYPPTSERPARLEFVGNTVASIRLFDPRSQRSLGPVSSLAIGPAAEVLAPFLSDVSGFKTLDLSGCNPRARRRLEQGLALLKEGQPPDDLEFYAPLFNGDSILSYLPPDGLVIVDEPADIESAVEHLDTEAAEIRSDRLARGELPPDFPSPYFTWPEIKAMLGKKQHLALTSWADGDENRHRLAFTAAPAYAGRLPLFFKKARQLLKRKHRLILCSHQAERLSEMLGEAAIVASPLVEISDVPPPGSLRLVKGLLARGWVMNGTSHLFTDSELFGFTKQRPLLKKRPVAHRRLFIDINPGDYVVHIDHGVARLGGIATMRRDGTEREYLVLEYAAGDRLYVPTDQIDRVGRYIGGGDSPPVLTRLGTQQWTRARQQARAAAADIAGELLKLYAAREVVPGFAFAADTVWQQELEASFPYVETPDQLTIQEQVKADMEQARPMDRFILGDVGYGKTEVAIRAAFKAVMDGKQVAVLVPTTVLAQQHFATFCQRLAAFPLRVEVLSRFRMPKEQQAILSGLADGSVDICIGTHRLLQPDVAFKDLGLLIIDEEQR